MKCPFRTITIKEVEIDRYPTSVAYGKVVKETETLDFSECIGEECPYHYFGRAVSGSGVNSVPKCKRAEV